MGFLKKSRYNKKQNELLDFFYTEKSYFFKERKLIYDYQKN